MIQKDKLVEKHFLSEYIVKFDPATELLKLKFDCPGPLMKVLIYKDDGLESYDAILVENGQLFDPTYEVLLREEKKLKGNLPSLALPVGNMDDALKDEITFLVKGMKKSFRKKLSEVILNSEKELTIILSVRGRPSSVFLGQGKWKDKINKLQRIVSYLGGKKKVPAIINITNPKKVVVKFNDKF